MTLVKLTNHAKEKSLSRFGLGADKLVELAEKSITIGYSINDAPSEQIKEFLLQKLKDQKKKIYGFNGYVFIFAEESNYFVLITTYRLPHKHLMSLK